MHAKTLVPLHQSYLSMRRLTGGVSCTGREGGGGGTFRWKGLVPLLNLCWSPLTPGAALPGLLGNDGAAGLEGTGGTPDCGLDVGGGGAADREGGGGGALGGADGALCISDIYLLSFRLLTIYQEVVGVQAVLDLALEQVVALALNLTVLVVQEAAPADLLKVAHQEAVEVVVPEGLAYFSLADQEEGRAVLVDRVSVDLQVEEVVGLGALRRVLMVLKVEEGARVVRQRVWAELEMRVSKVLSRDQTMRLRFSTCTSPSDQRALRTGPTFTGFLEFGHSTSKHSRQLSSWIVRRGGHSWSGSRRGSSWCSPSTNPSTSSSTAACTNNGTCYGRTRLVNRLCLLQTLPGCMVSRNARWE